MKLFFKAQFGSNVYGTNLPSSDVDYKGIFLPNPKDIVLQKAADHYKENTKEDTSKRNEAGDIDFEAFSLQRYLKLLAEGQTVSLDLLFTPDKFIIQNDLNLFNEIKTHRHKFLHKGTASFFGYAKTQAAKYGLKGSRISALKAILAFLEPLPSYKRLSDFEDQLNQFVLDNANLKTDETEPLIKYTFIKSPRAIVEKHIEVNNRKFALHSDIKYLKERFNEYYENYGHRARLAEINESVDWKACMHAVRVSREAQELLLTHNITFPRPEKDLLLKIRKGEMDYKAVAEIIEQGLVDINSAKEKSTLPEGPDYEFIDDFVCNKYLNLLEGL